MPLHDFELDIDSLKQKMLGQAAVTDAGEGVDTTAALRAGAHDHGGSSHADGSCGSSDKSCGHQAL
jgi:hypothetical protein